MKQKIKTVTLFTVQGTEGVGVGFSVVQSKYKLFCIRSLQCHWKIQLSETDP